MCDRQPLEAEGSSHIHRRAYHIQLKVPENQRERDFPQNLPRPLHHESVAQRWGRVECWSRVGGRVEWRDRKGAIGHRTDEVCHLLVHP